MVHVEFVSRRVPAAGTWDRARLATVLHSSMGEPVVIFSLKSELY